MMRISIILVLLLLVLFFNASQSVPSSIKWIPFTANNQATVSTDFSSQHAEQFYIRLPCEQSVWFKLFLNSDDGQNSHVEIKGKVDGNIYCNGAGDKSWFGGEVNEFFIDQRALECDSTETFMILVVEKSADRVTLKNKGQVLYHQAFTDNDANCRAPTKIVTTQVFYYEGWLDLGLPDSSSPRYKTFPVQTTESATPPTETEKPPTEAATTTPSKTTAPPTEAATTTPSKTTSPPTEAATTTPSKTTTPPTEAATTTPSKTTAPPTEAATTTPSKTTATPTEAYHLAHTTKEPIQFGDYEEPVVPGEPGEPGAPGAPGAQGVRGNRGDQGDGMYCDEYCFEGEVGERGEPGSDGAQGEEGDTGPPGLKGDPGFPGNDGENGPEGAMGDSGEPGMPGMPGTDGTDGRPRSCGVETSSCSLKLGHCYAVSSFKVTTQCRLGYAATSIWRNSKFWGLRCCKIVGHVESEVV